MNILNPIRAASSHATSTVLAAAFLGSATLAMPTLVRAEQSYRQTNLVSDVPGLAATTDPNLVNAWGLASSATSFWWVSDNGTGLSTLYNGTGAKQTLVVTVPPAAGQTEPSAPTGIVFNSTTDFNVGTGQPARFIFVTENGTISGWNPAASPTTAITVVDDAGRAIYKGLAIAQNAGANLLYTANFLAGTVDVFDGKFAAVVLGPKAFHDPQLPAGYAPFNVQALNGELYVAYAQQDSAKMDAVAGAGLGYVDVFAPDGTLKRRLQAGRWMNAPWGITLAPANFGRFSGQLLVGQFGSGLIAAFDPTTGLFSGYLADAEDEPLHIDGLWGLAFGNNANAGPSTTLFFTAGINDEAHGLFGSITSVSKADNDNSQGDEDEGGDND